MSEHPLAADLSLLAKIRNHVRVETAYPYAIRLMEQAADELDRQATRITELSAVAIAVAESHDANCSPDLRIMAARALGRLPSDMTFVDGEALGGET